MSDEETVHVMVPNRDAASQMTAELAKTLQSLEEPDDGKEYEVKVNFSYLQPIDANRNRMVKKFLDNPDADWLLMVDNDVVPPVDILDMIQHDQPVVSATVCIKKGTTPQPIILKESGDQYRQVGLNEYVDEVRDNGLLEVEGVGTGCLLIRRDVLENMEPPWFKFKYSDTGDLQLGEDFYFSRRLKEQGVSMFVDTEKICGHFKTVDLSNWAMDVANAKGINEESEDDEVSDDE